jgi:hypothetical protein
MNKFFKLIEVKTLEDLPKETTTVIYGKYKNSVTIEAIEFHKEDLSWGLANIDWYFLPVTEEELQEEICIYPRIKK